MGGSQLMTFVAFHLLVGSFVVAMLLLFKWPGAWYVFLSTFVGMLIGFIDMQTDAVQLPALLLLAFGSFIGFSHPRNAWLIGLLLAMWVPVVQVARLLVPGGHPEGFMISGCLLPFVFSMAGSYAGVAVCRGARMLHPDAGDLLKVSR